MRIIDLFALQVFAKNLDRCNSRLLQHYPPEADVQLKSIFSLNGHEEDSAVTLIIPALCPDVQ